jgi:GNAT superfamily N-acetyltransferase
MNDVAHITLRAASADDAERLATLLTDEGYPAGPSDLAARIERFSTPEARVVVAEAGGTVVGFVAFNVGPRFEIDETYIRIAALVVDPLERERGVAHRLLAEVERVAREEGISFLEVTAGHHRPDARQLFESLGYDAGVTAYLRKRP